MMRLGREIALLVLAAGALACASAGKTTASGVVETARDARVILVRSPLAIGFFPIVTDENRGEDVDSAAEHFTYAVGDMARCLQPKGIPVQIIEAKSMVIENGAARSALNLAPVSNESIGCYLVAPNREPMIVRAIAGASSLMALCPSAASVYFNVPECCPSGWRCCPDGTAVDESYECAG
jgi:hypothetical protein